MKGSEGMNEMNVTEALLRQSSNSLKSAKRLKNFARASSASCMSKQKE